jgi:hypothetical protein
LDAGKIGKPFEALAGRPPVAELTAEADRFILQASREEEVASTMRQESEGHDGVEDTASVVEVLKQPERRVEQLLRPRVLTLDACTVPKQQRRPGIAALVSQIAEPVHGLGQQRLSSGMVPPCLRCVTQSVKRPCDTPPVSEVSEEGQRLLEQCLGRRVVTLLASPNPDPDEHPGYRTQVADLAKERECLAVATDIVPVVTLRQAQLAGGMERPGAE